VSPAKGLVYIFTGDGKGKTSAALGVAMRAVCAGLKVAWVAWYKEASWDIAEKGLPELIDMEMFFLGKGFHIQDSRKDLKTAWLKTGGVVVDKATAKAHRQAAQAALKKARKLLQTQKYEVLVCDEINNTLADGLLDIKQIIELLKERGKTHLVLTGRNAPRKLIELADLVTEMRKVKHPYDQGKKAVKGLDF